MKKILSLLFVSSLLLFMSCGSDEGGPSEPTIQEIQQDIQATFDGFVTCMQGYENGAFSTAFQSFFAMSNGEMNSDYAELLTDELGEFDFDVEDFNLSDHSGVYIWSSNSETWSYTSNTTNTLVFEFPFTQSGTSNNTVITIDSIAIEELVLQGDTEYFLSRLLGTIEKDGSEIFNIDLDNVTYTTTDDTVSATSFDLEIRTIPMTHHFTLSELSNNHFTFDYSSYSESSCNTTISLDASTVISDFSFLEELEDFANVSGTIAHDNLKVLFNVQADNLNSIDEPTAAQINQLFEAKVYLANSEIGELAYNDDNDSKIIYIVYNDGTKEDVKNYINQDLADQLEAVFSNYID